MTFLKRLHHSNGKKKLRILTKITKNKPISFKKIEKLMRIINIIEFFDEKAQKYPEITFYKQICDKLIKDFEQLISKYIK